VGSFLHQGKFLQLPKSVQELLAGARFRATVTTLSRPRLSRAPSGLLHGLRHQALEQVRDALAGYSRAQGGGEWRRRTKTKLVSILEV